MEIECVTIKFNFLQEKCKYMDKKSTKINKMHQKYKKNYGR